MIDIMHLIFFVDLEQTIQKIRSMMNKSIYTFLFLLSFTFTFGQTQKKSFINKSLATKRADHLKAKSEASRSVIDTAELFFPSWTMDCSNSFDLFGPTNAWGFVSGMNEFIDLAKAQQLEFTLTPTYRLLGGICYVGEAIVVNDGDLQMNFYQLDASTGGPGEMLASSVTRKASDLILPDSFIRPTLFVIPPDMQPTLEDPNFFAGLHFGALYATLDTVAVLQTLVDCGDGTNTWELVSSPDTTWVDIKTSWDLDADFAITAVIAFDEATSDESFIKTADLTLHPAFPNPTQDQVTLTYELDASGPVQVEILDYAGKRIARKSIQSQAGLNQELIQTQSYSSGLYYYILTSRKGSIASTFTVTR